MITTIFPDHLNTGLANLLITDVYHIPEFEIPNYSWHFVSVAPPKKQGYTPIGVCGFDFVSGAISLSRVNLTGCWVFNIDSHAKTITNAVIRILYIRQT